MDGTSDNAAHFLEKACAAVAGGDLANARRLLDKSVRIYPHEPLCSRQARCAAAIRKAQPVPPRRPPSPEPPREATPEMVAAVRLVQAAAKKGHYAVLGLERGATEADVLKAFRKLVLVLHTDKNFAAGAKVRFRPRAFGCTGLLLMLANSPGYIGVCFFYLSIRWCADLMPGLLFLHCCAALL